MKKKLGKCKQITSTREGNSYLAGSEKINIQTKYEKRNWANTKIIHSSFKERKVIYI